MLADVGAVLMSKVGSTNDLVVKEMFLMQNEKPLKERQIETAQYVVDLIAEDRPEHKGKKVAEIEPTENANELIIRFNDWTTMKVFGLFAQKILEGRPVVL